ncbi:ABC transporter ATP-binding protein [Zavarzinia compransoris]|uniref:ABC transporter ATP-binding protein n=1 Tax=Zavarzinia marina TaxID=2911065 RepID=UPI001F197944|nr:ABC transporter ATP-binding protein [Zavarzinia marina]MCF4166381.1 ABC transporter ATP-binding protein [Zavarzinia marina]
MVDSDRPADAGVRVIISASRPATAPGIAVRGAGLRFEAQVHFEGLDLDLAGGETTCLLGPSGVGKSSLLRLLAGLPTAGLGGTVSAGDGRPLAGRTALMAQHDNLLPWASVLDNVMLGDRLRGDAPDAPRAHALLAQLGLSTAAGLRPTALSGGMRQRAALARTLYEDCPIVLMDEPFSALDAVTRHRLQGETAGVLAGRTVLLVTHDPLEALRLGHHVLVLSGRPARLRQVTPPPGDVPRAAGDPALASAQDALFAALSSEGA